MGRGDFANFSANPVYKGFLMGFINMCEMLSTFNLENKECRNMSEVERIVGENRLVRTKTTTKSESKVIQDSTETWETNKKGSGYKKVQIKLNGETQTPTDNGLSTGAKTPEQEANLAKLAAAREFLKTDEGAKLAQNMLDQQNGISKGQKKWLEKQGVDADAFVQEWNRANPQSANNKLHNAQVSAQQKEELGTLANTHLGVGENREGSPEADRKLPDKRTFFQKLFKTKDKQKVKADAQHGFDTATKVNMHSSTAERKGDLEHTVADDMSRAADKYLESYEVGHDGKKRKTFKEIDENGNVVKTKVRYNKDGSVKKVVTKGDSDGKLIVKQAKDGDITVKGNLQSDFVYEKNPDVREIHTDRYKEVGTIQTITTDNDYQQTIIEREKCPEPPAPPAKEPIQGGLISDFVNDQNPNGMGSVQGSTIRAEFKSHGASEMADSYCSFTNDNAPAQAKTMWKKNPGQMANIYNGKHLAESLINDAENKKVDEESLNSFITALRAQGRNDALSGVKQAILDHNENVTPSGGFKEGTRTVNQKVTISGMAVDWLMKSPEIKRAHID